MSKAREIGAERVELYTESYARAHAIGDGRGELESYSTAARAAQGLGLGVNAGHDLSHRNLADFCLAVPDVNAPAAARHLVWAVALVGVLVIPALSRAMPWKLEVLPAIESSALVEAHVDRTRIPVTGRLEMEGPTNNTARWSWEVPTAQLVVSWAPWIWLLGVGVVALRIAISFGAIRWMVWRRASPNPGDWDGDLGAAQCALGLTGPVRLMVSRLASIPFTTGTWRPMIVLPPSSTAWDRGLRRTVLLHELSHIKRRDALIHLVSQAACAIYWFHPLVWVAARRARIECERACDDLVLNAGARPAVYAEHLLSIVRGATSRWTPALALPMARRAALEERLLAILESNGGLRSLSRRSAGMIITWMVLAVIPLTALAPTRCDDPVTAVQGATCPMSAELSVSTETDGVPAPDPVVAPSETAESALARLEEAQRRLEQDRMEQLATGVDEARARAADLAREQRDIEAEMDRHRLGTSARPGPGAGRRLFDRKEAMQEEIADLEREIHRLRDEARADQREVSDRLDDAARTIADDKLKERVRYSRGLIGIQDREFMREFEAETTRVVEELQEELQRASDAI